MLFRLLDDEERLAFIRWAEENDTPEHRANADIYHPVVRATWERIDNDKKTL